MTIFATQEPTQPFDWVDWNNVLQTTWLFKYFKGVIEGDRTRASLLHWYASGSSEDRNSRILNAKKAWAVKKHRSQKGQPLQIYLSAHARQCLTKASNSLNINKDELIERLIQDQSVLHHKELTNSEKLRTQNKILLSRIQRLEVIRMETLVERNAHIAELSDLRAQISNLKSKE